MIMIRAFFVSYLTVMKKVEETGDSMEGVARGVLEQDEDPQDLQ